MKIGSSSMRNKKLIFCVVVQLQIIIAYLFNVQVTQFLESLDVMESTIAEIIQMKKIVLTQVKFF